MKKNIIEQIVRYIDEHNILYEYDNYEQMPVFHVLTELDCLSNFIKKDYYISFCVNMATMYVNQGLLYAKSKLSEKELKFFIIYFELCINKDKDGDYITVDVVFSRKADKHMSMLGTPIDIKDAKIYEHVNKTIGINDYICYMSKNEFDDEYYSFIPKCIENQINQRDRPIKSQSKGF